LIVQMTHSVPAKVIEPFNNEEKYFREIDLLEFIRHLDRVLLIEEHERRWIRRYYLVIEIIGSISPILEKLSWIRLPKMTAKVTLRKLLPQCMRPVDLRYDDLDENGIWIIFVMGFFRYPNKGETGLNLFPTRNRMVI